MIVNDVESEFSLVMIGFWESFFVGGKKSVFCFLSFVFLNVLNRLFIKCRKFGVGCSRWIIIMFIVVIGVFYIGVFFNSVILIIKVVNSIFYWFMMV